MFWGMVLLLPSPGKAVARQTPAKESPPDYSMQQHYDSAVHFQSAGNTGQAKLEYRLFLADALHRLAKDRSQIGEYPRAVPLFDQALNLTPNDPVVALDYAEASLVARDRQKAKSLAQGVLAADSKNARAHLLLGRAFLGMNENKQAKMSSKRR